MNILESNKLIAEFMGVKPIKNFYDGHELHKAGLPFAYGAMGNGTSELKFHTSWDWLMPVVKKIDKIASPMHVRRYESGYDYHGEKSIVIKKFLFTRITSDIMYAYEVVVEFINWYNKREAK